MMFRAKGAVTCSRCGRAFQPRLEDEPLNDGSVKRLFRCTRCGWEHPVARISAYGLKLTEELQNVVVSAPDAKKTIARLRKQLKKEVTRWAE